MSPIRRKASRNPQVRSSPVLVGATTASNDGLIVGEVLPPAADEVNVGGWKTHKPGCKCNPCKARRGTEEAIAEPAGGLTRALDGEGSGRPDVIVIGAPREDKRRIIAEYIAITSADPDLSQKEVAERIGIGTRALNNTIKLAVREGWLRFEDPLETLKHDIIPHATRNLKSLMKKKDKFATIETMKHTVFRDYQSTQGTNVENQTVLAIKIEGMKPEGSVKVVAGQVLGKPRHTE